MKKRFTLLALALGIMLAVQANPIDRAEARLIAQEAVGIDDQSDDNVPIAPYYVFSRGAGKGFVIVSGDDSTTPILGYTEQGDFVFDQLPEPLQQMLNNWSERISQVQAKPTQMGPKRSPRERLAQARKGVDAFKEKWTDIPVLCPTAWHQSSPYNDLAPTNPDNPSQRALTGCVATASAQIIYYFRKDNPAELLYATPTYHDDWGEGWGNYPVTESLPKGTPVEYDLMKLNYNSGGSAKSKHAVAVLMYAIGTCSRLNYGPSTGGQCSDAGEAMKNQFMLDNEYVGKWNYNQQSWETKVYKSLKNGSPMLYSGVVPDTDNGHAVVLDGYQARTGTYHFNFGWGGQGDGWYTIDDETGMNGWSSGQSGCLNFKPQKQNLGAEMIVPKDNKLYNQAISTFKVNVTNNGTLPYSGIHFYVNTSKNALPTSANKSNTTDVIEPGETKEFLFEYKPTSVREAIYFFVTDDKKNILARDVLEVLPCTPDMTLHAISVDAGTRSKEFQEMTFGTVNNTTATITANISNSYEGTYCMPRITCYLWRYDPEAGEWTKSNTEYVSNVGFEPGETKPVKFQFKNLYTGYYYKGFLNKEVRAGSAFELKHANLDTLVCFQVVPADLTVTVEGRKATVKGHWNNEMFKTLDTDGNVCSYDMTEVEELTEMPEAVNPNALFYTGYPIKGARNVVNGGVCDMLVINANHEFMAAEPFKAAKATITLPVSEAGIWGDALIPFVADVPYGMQMKRFTDIGATSVNTETITKVDAMTPVLYMASRDKHNTISATNVDITVETQTTVAEGDIVTSTLSGEMPAQGMLLGYKNEVPYYLPTEQTAVAPFAVVVTKYNKSGFRAVPAAEVRYPDLALAINDAYIAKETKGGFATAETLATFEAAIKEAEDMFTYLTAEKSSEVRTATNTLREAIDAFLADVATDINDHLQFDNIQFTIEKSNVVYDLSGRQIVNSKSSNCQLKKGIYIVNGKKIIVK